MLTFYVFKGTLKYLNKHNWPPLYIVQIIRDMLGSVQSTDKMYVIVILYTFYIHYICFPS